MRPRRLTEAERLRRHNDEMKLALAENVSVLEARRRLGARMRREFEANMERLRRCGTSDVQQAKPHSDYSPPAPGTQSPEPRYWWLDRD